MSGLILYRLHWNSDIFMALKSLAHGTIIWPQFFTVMTLWRITWRENLDNRLALPCTSFPGSSLYLEEEGGPCVWGCRLWMRDVSIFKTTRHLSQFNGNPLLTGNYDVIWFKASLQLPIRNCKTLWIIGVANSPSKILGFTTFKLNFEGLGVKIFRWAQALKIPIRSFVIRDFFPSVETDF